MTSRILTRPDREYCNQIRQGTDPHLTENIVTNQIPTNPGRDYWSKKDSDRPGREYGKR